MENSVCQILVAEVDIPGIQQRSVEVSCPPVKGRVEEAAFWRSGDLPGARGAEAPVFSGIPELCLS